jgi:uncharacterized protein YneF (UPF0154 family)
VTSPELALLIVGCILVGFVIGVFVAAWMMGEESPSPEK